MATSIGITSIGMVSSLGLSAVSACAAVRAGIVAPSPLDYEVVDQDAAESIPVAGHVVKGFADGFTGAGRLIRLGAEALADLLHGPEIDRRRLEQGTAVFVHTGDRHYRRLYLERVVALELDESDAAAELLHDAADEERTRREAIEPLLVPSLLDLNGLDVPAPLQALSFGGPAGFVQLMLRAIDLLRAGRASRCLLGAVDSLIDSETLDQLYALGLLHSIENPVGRMPGEAAAFLLLENLGRTTAGGSPAAIVDAAATATVTPSSPPGQALADAFTACLSAASPAGAASRVVIQNQSGDEASAAEFGHALARLAAAGVRTDQERWYPAASFGETGAATGAVAGCMAVRSFARGYARGPGIITWFSSDDDLKGALILRDPAVRSSP